MTAARARLMLLAAVALGLSGDLLFRAWPWRLNLVGWVALALIAACATGWEQPFTFDRSPRGRDRMIALVATFAAAIGLVLRDASTLYFYDLVALLTCAAITVWLPLGRSLPRFRIRDAVRAWWAAILTTLGGAPLLVFRDAEWASTTSAGGRRVRAAAIGTLLALPPVFVVSSLLAQADPRFDDLLRAWPRLGLEEVAGHLAVAALVAWPAAGWLRGMVRPIVSPIVGRYLPPARIDFLGIAPALYAIVGLLAVFLGLQARALFGGAAYVEATTGLTYAEFARGGFFQLVAVTAIVLGLLLLGDWVLDRREGEAARRFQTAGWALLALLGVLMASALQRMWVYVSFYGLSDTRLYATAGMVWVGVALGWFGWTILRGRRARFGIGLLVASAGWIAALNVLNPDAVVVRVNLARALAGSEFDIPYHAYLSADAVPALVDAAEQLPATACGPLVAKLHEVWTKRSGEGLDWRTWSLPTARARRLLDHSIESLQRDHCPAFIPSDH